MVMTEGSIVKLIYFGPKAVDLSGTEALGLLSSTVVLQPPAPMPRKSQTVRGRVPLLCLCSGQHSGLFSLPLAGGQEASSQIPGLNLGRT